jgi:hypothetical protein
MQLINLLIISGAGFLLGIIGAAIGSTLLILVPMLNFFGLPIHIALGTSKLSVLGREILAIYQYNRKKLIDFRIVLPFIIGSAVLSFVGTYIILGLDERILEVIIAIFMIIIATIFILNPKAGMKTKKKNITKKTVFLSMVAGSIIGFYQGIFGGGTTVFIIFSFIFLFGNNFLNAAANSKLPNLIFAAISTFVFIYKGFIDWYVAIPLLITTSLGSSLGARLAIKKGNSFIRMLFVLLVVVLAVKMLFF